MYKGKVMGLRVLFLTSNYPRGKGDYAGNFVHYLARNLRKAGHDIIVIAPHYPGSRTRENLHGISVKRFRYVFPASQQRLAYGGFVRIKTPVVALQLLPYMLGMLIQGITSMKEIEVDFIVSFWTFPQGLIGSILKWLFRKPVAIRVQSNDLLTAKRISSFMISLFNRIFAIADLLIPNSDYTKSLMPQISAFMDKTITIREGIDLEKFTPIKVNKLSDTKKSIQKKLLTVAILIERKGIKYLLYAMKKVTKITNVKLFIVGEGPKRETLENLSQQLNLQQYVIFTGKVSNEELVRHYASSDVFILPSIKEALGVVLLEAMCMGIPVIASKVGGIPEIVIHKKTGILVPPRDSEALANSIMFLIDNPKICSKYGKNGQKFVHDNFTWEKISKKFEKAFLETLKPDQ